MSGRDLILTKNNDSVNTPRGTHLELAARKLMHLSDECFYARIEIAGVDGLE